MACCVQFPCAMQTEEGVNPTKDSPLGAGSCKGGNKKKKGEGNDKVLQARFCVGLRGRGSPFTCW